MTLSSIYLTLRKSYYCGKFEYPEGSGTFYRVNHESIISEELFERVQQEVSCAPKSHPGSKEFSFVRLLKCGACGSGVTAEEKFKKMKSGTVRRYVYYHCTHKRDLDCHEPYIREEDLITQLSGLTGKLDIKELAVRKKLEHEATRYSNFMKQVLGKSVELKLPEIDVKRYMQHVLATGSRDERRELLTSLRSNLQLKDRQVVLAEDTKEVRQ
jgi:hypothetical protein